MCVPAIRCVGLNVSRCLFDQLFGLGNVSYRGLSKAENVDSLIWDVKCLHKGRGGEIEGYFLYLCVTRGGDGG